MQLTGPILVNESDSHICQRVLPLQRVRKFKYSLYYDNTITQLKDIDFITGPVKDNFNATITQNVATITATSKNGLLDIATTTNGKGKDLRLRILASGPFVASRQISSFTGGTGGTENQTGLAITGGSGSSATANIASDDSKITTVTINAVGSGYMVGDKLTIDASLITDSSVSITFTLVAADINAPFKVHSSTLSPTGPNVLNVKSFL